MKRLLTNKKAYRVFYLFGFVVLMSGMLLSMLNIPVQASFNDQVEVKAKATKPAAKPKVVKATKTPKPTKTPKATKTPKPTKTPLDPALPTSAETGFPTGMPSVMPSVGPTSVPTQKSTEMPTQMPTIGGTSMPTIAATKVPTVGATTGSVAFTQGDTAVCQMGATSLSASVTVSLPAGETAILQTAWKIAEPADLRTAEVYSETTVTNGQTVSVSGSWPGVRPTDTTVELHLGAILLNSETHNPISAGAGIDYYWYPWFCPVSGGVTATTAPTIAATKAPTTAPTIAATKAPTTVPTIAATTVPTIAPTKVPTVVPTIAATKVPTTIPTLVPTIAATKVPTLVPTIAATKVPTLVPTIAATKVPTSVPTMAATKVPTIAVTKVPTIGATGTIFPTTAPTQSGVLGVTFLQGDTAVCQMTPGSMSAQVRVTLPSGMTDAVLETAWKVAEPVDLRTSEVYTNQTVHNGDVITVTGQWPGVRATDQVVEIHLGAILLDTTSLNPISAGAGIDYYWYPWFCPFTGGGATATTIPTIAVTKVPTLVPTIAATKVPTLVPTIAATKIPTLVPTIAATKVPTLVPTMIPTLVPTIAATKVPTLVPTMIPTLVPTIAATKVPTLVPTMIPTLVPTIAATKVPTLVPTIAATKVPTLVPTIAATKIPTLVPTIAVTKVPTVGATETLFPTTVPTTAPTSAPTQSGVLGVTFLQGDTAVCQMTPGSLSAQVRVTLPAGMTDAVLETAWKVAEPVDLRTSEVYTNQTVHNGDVVTVTGQWPGVRATDQVVEIHLGAILLDTTTLNPISAGAGMDYYWYPWFCPFTGGGATATTVPTIAATKVPTLVPTIAVTTVPTLVPTIASTKIPTLVPTIAATSVPTLVPTIAATKVPTLVPTLIPTLVPTIAATKVPTLVPTIAATKVPTLVPTIAATKVPTLVPTIAATKVPTLLPTVGATETLFPTTVPTNVPTSAPTSAPTQSGTLGVTFLQGDTAVCQMAAGSLSAQVRVSLPSGVTEAVLETAWKVAEPVDLRTSEVYTNQTVHNGDVITVTGQWPGVRSTDQVVEIHLGAILLDATTLNPISAGAGMDYYWYPWFCPFSAGGTTPTTVPVTGGGTVTPTLPVIGGTAVPTMAGTQSPTQVPVNQYQVAFTTESAPICQMTSGAISAQVRVTLPAGVSSAVLQTNWNVAEPADLRAGNNYKEVNVKNGDVVTITATWPGVRATDSVVSVSFGAVLLNSKTHNPISSVASLSRYWYPWVCPFTGATAVPTVGVGGTEVPPTQAPTQAPVVSPEVQFTTESQPLCMMNAGPVDAQVRVILPAGMTATLQTAWKVSEPSDLRGSEHYQKVSVMNGDVITITASWPGVRLTDQVVSVHFGAILLDSHGNPFSMGTGIDYYWYSWACSPNAQPTTTPVPTSLSQPVQPSMADVLANWWHVLLRQLGWKE